MALCRGLPFSHSLRTLCSASASGLRPLTVASPLQEHQKISVQCSSDSVLEISPYRRRTSFPGVISVRPVTQLSGNAFTCLTLQSSLPDGAMICRTSSSSITDYSCPNRLLENFSELIIQDRQPTTSLVYKCPVSTPVVDTVSPDIEKSEILEPGSKPVEKSAKQIMRIRHKKMKKHKLKKLRKRMYFLWKKQKQARKAKRLTIYNKELDDIRETGENFSAEDYVRSQLSKARRGGYFINVFESKQ